MRGGAVVVHSHCSELLRGVAGRQRVSNCARLVTRVSALAAPMQIFEVVDRVSRLVARLLQLHCLVRLLFRVGAQVERADAVALLLALVLGRRSLLAEDFIQRAVRSYF